MSNQESVSVQSSATKEDLDVPHVIHVEGLCKDVSLAGGHTLSILKNIDFEVQQGDSVAIVGKSGSGKTTLLGLLAGLDTSTSGKVQLLGHALEEMSEDQRAALRAKDVGFVFQSFHLLPTLSALENVLMPLELQGRSDAKDKAVELLDRFGLGDRLGHFPAQLSGGEQQRVALARAFASEPKVLFADEPTGNLDSQTGDQIIEELFTQNKQHGTTLVIVTHDKELAKKCSKRLIIEDGTVVSEA